jgi:hypothetical protein
LTAAGLRLRLSFELTQDPCCTKLWVWPMHGEPTLGEDALRMECPDADD